MKVQTPFVFVFQAITVGLALAFLLLLWKPELFQEDGRVVEFVERTTSGARAPARAPAPSSYAPAVQTAAPSVVNIYTRKVVEAQRSPLFDDPIFRHFFGDMFGRPQERTETSLGSGVIINDTGYILTNNHVIDGAEAIQVALHDGRTTGAEVVGTDPESDLAVLKVELEQVPAITLGPSESLQVGDVVLAIGNPFGVGQTVTLGIVSATGRNQLGLNTFENFIQTDAAINPGNSGGALINTNGELVGINTAIFSRTGGSQGIGFAIPMSLAKGIMQQIIEHGEVRRGWLGVEIQGLTPALAESFELDDAEGVVIAGVLQGGPADRAGLKPGDVVTKIDGKAIGDTRDALNAIAQTRPGEDLAVAGVREGEPFQVSVQVSERPNQLR